MVATLFWLWWELILLNSKTDWKDCYPVTRPSFTERIIKNHILIQIWKQEYLIISIGHWSPSSLFHTVRCFRIYKTIHTLFPSTFKVSENKVPLVFPIFAQWVSLAISEFKDVTLLTWLTENEKMAISQPLSQNWKN